jgi:hypothetical protein
VPTHIHLLHLGFVAERECTPAARGATTGVSHQLSLTAPFYFFWQVLLATGGGQLVYLEVGDGDLTEVKNIQLHKEISCLDMHPIGSDPDEAAMAAVGLWSMEVSPSTHRCPPPHIVQEEVLQHTVY